MEELKIHPIANSFPMMSKKEYSGLVGSMEKDGFDKNFPIVLFEEQILDGRNRYKAAREVAIEPIFRTFEGTFEEAVKESQKLNLKRRNMNKNQLAMTAAKEVIRTRESETEKKISLPKAANIHNISITYIKRALNIYKDDIKLAEHVFNGKVTISQAEHKIGEIQRAREPAAEFESDVEEKEQSSDNITDKETASKLAELEEKEEELTTQLDALQSEYIDAISELTFYRENCTCNLQYKTGH